MHLATTDTVPAFVFVSQRGDVELKSILLAASLREAIGPEGELVAMVPEMFGEVRAPTAESLEVLAGLGVRVVHFRNAACRAGTIERTGDGHINKAYCLTAAVPGRIAIVVDSDVLCLAAPEWAGVLDGACVAAKPVDLQNEHRWAAIYGVFGMDVPAAQLASTVSGELGPPYFNSGLVAVAPHTAAPLAAMWLDTFDRLTASGMLDDNLFFREQLSLSVAVQRLGVPYRAFDERYNFPAHLRPLDADSPPVFAHYHQPAVIRRESRLSDVTRTLCRRHPALAARLAREPEWAEFV